MMFYKQSSGGAHSNNHCNQLVIKQLLCLPHQHERKHIDIHSVNSPNTHPTVSASLHHPDSSVWLILLQLGKVLRVRDEKLTQRPLLGQHAKYTFILSDLFVSARVTREHIKALLKRFSICLGII